MPPQLGLRVKHSPSPVGLPVITYLEGVTADQNLSRAHKAAQGLLIVAQKRPVHVVRRIAGHDEQYRDRVIIAARALNVIGQILEDQTLIERPE